MLVVQGFADFLWRHTAATAVLLAGVIAVAAADVASHGVNYNDCAMELIATSKGSSNNGIDCPFDKRTPPLLENRSVSQPRLHVRLQPRSDIVPPNATAEVRLAVLAEHDAHRIRALNTQIEQAIAVRQRKGSGQFSSSFNFSVNAGPGLHMMELTLGTPPQSFPLIMDTGSELVWMQCQPCKSCVNQSAPLFSPSSSSTYAVLPCSSGPCQSLPGQCGSANSCQYSYSYASQANTQGQLGTETLMLSSPDGRSSTFTGLAFGCGFNNQGQYGGAAGLVGMGQSALSLPSQLGKVVGGKKFSYCLYSQANSSSDAAITSLLMGDAATADAANMQFTPMVVNSAVVASLYYVNVLGFSVNNMKLNIPANTFAIQEDGRGGMILDSGTTYTYLPGDAFSVVEKAFDTFVKLPRYSSHPYLPLCYRVANTQQRIEIPSLTLHLQGADLSLPFDNYFTKVDDEGTYCLAMIPTSGGLQVLGNMLHQKYRVLYDIDNSRIGFNPNSC
ncbi:hypothetical protein KP509_12G045900 [Ceratopteris richardii]|uniref:Peptidase A1 domain-containing protein n=1 Tax=Ceratopteris richardii TaxID=49495 RepID=A0A8T2TLD4_CERRI|nr:hypothetical protein KP509_12G045900 [Ceratopteris richardii]